MSSEIKIRISVQGQEDGEPRELYAQVKVPKKALKKKGREAFLGLVLGGAEKIWSDIERRGWVG